MKPRRFSKSPSVEVESNLARFDDCSSLGFWITLFGVVFIAFGTRYYKISEPDHVW